MKKISEAILFKGVWLALHETVFINEHGQEIKWESIKRQQSTVGVVVLARMVPSRRFILIKQYRPALEGHVIGFPAGLANDDINQALVELKEETGYHGVIKEVSPVLKSGSGVLNDSGRVVYIEVDENDPRNHNPRQELEPSEQIEVIVIKREDIKEFLLKEYEKGTHIGANLWYLFVLGEMINNTI